MKSLLKYFITKSTKNLTIKNFSGDISQDQDCLLEHSTDSSIFKIIPKLVLYPKSNQDIISIIQDINIKNQTLDNQQPKINISVRAGGTCMSGGSLNTDHILNLTKYMNKIIIDKDNMTAEVQMGAMLKDIQKEADKYNLMFAPYPSSKDICGIGGIIGNNASGEKSIRFGSAIDNVLSLEVILANGQTLNTGIKNIKDLLPLEQKLLNIIKDDVELFKQKAGRVTKVASGYRIDKIILDNDKIDLTPLFIGAQGTLGIITKATLKLVPKPEFSKLIVAPIQNIKDITPILKLSKKYNAESIETFDINTYQKAKQVLPQYTKYTDFVFNNNTSAIILIQFSEQSQLITDNIATDFCKTLSDLSIQSFIIDKKEVQDAFWNIRRNSFSLVRDHHASNQKAVPCIEDIILPIENFEYFIPKLVEILKEENIEYAYHGHIGDGSLRIIPLFDFNNKNITDNIIRLTRNIMNLIKTLDGNISADHSDGIIRTPFLKEFYGEKIYTTFEKIKILFDSNNIMNPRKKIGGNIEDIKKYINLK